MVGSSSAKHGQSIQNRVDLVRYQSPTTALRRIQHDSLWCWCLASRVCSRSWCPNWQQHDTFESRQQRSCICFYQLRQLRIIQHSLTTDAAHSLVRALIHTRVDYSNGLLAAGPKYLHEKLQSVLRAAARLVLQLPYRASVSDIMRRQLHWLEIPDRVRFKLCTLVYRCLHGLDPHYLSDLCTPAHLNGRYQSPGRKPRR